MQESLKKLLFIYNPKAGKGAILQKLSTIIDLFTAAGYLVTAYPTQKRADATNLVLDETLTQRSNMHYDRDGDSHYDILSALQKSIRGSDENAALHYAARLIEAGDIISLSRRLLVIAAEDIGLAYPQAIPIVKACVDSAMQLGLPEARLPLGDAVILLATAPKSNSGIMAIDAALDDVRNKECGDFPRHLQNKHLDGEGAEVVGQHYLYPHNFPDHYVEQQYLPDPIKDRVYYEYGENKTEQAAKQYWDKIKKR